MIRWECHYLTAPYPLFSHQDVRAVLVLPYLWWNGSPSSSHSVSNRDFRCHQHLPPPNGDKCIRMCVNRQSYTYNAQLSKSFALTTHYLYCRSAIILHATLNSALLYHVYLKRFKSSIYWYVRDTMEPVCWQVTLQLNTQCDRLKKASLTLSWLIAITIPHRSAQRWHNEVDTTLRWIGKCILIYQMDDCTYM